MQVHFHRIVHVSTFSIMFQGGFVGQDVQVHVKRAEKEAWEKVTDSQVDPEDSNALQEFACQVQQVNALALTFHRSTDFYGRIVIYRLQISGGESN